ncbi:FecR domain-containing protein [Chloroflexota bacterium]
MNSKLTKILDECISRIGRGDSIESCLADYPELESKLRPLLDTFTSISKAPRVTPSASFREQSKARVMASIRQLDTPEYNNKKPVLPSIFGWKRVAIPVVSVVVLVIAALLLPNIFGLWSTTKVLAQPCTLSVIGGEVEFRNTDYDLWESAADGTVLDTGNYIKTNGDSYAILTFFDGSTMELEPESTVAIEKIQYGNRVTEIAVKQLSGVTWSHVLAAPELGSNFQVKTPSAEITVQNTLFTVEVDKYGATRVAVTEGTVNISAHKQVIRLLADQQTTVNVGMAPALPVAGEDTLNRLLIAVELPGVCSVGDPNGLSTGYLPNGVSFNQIKGSLAELLPDGRQSITIPQLQDGRYLLAIRNAGRQPIRLNIQAISEDGVVLNYKDEIGGTGDGNIIVCLNIAIEGSKIINAEIIDIKPLADSAPERLVVTRLAIERALSARAVIEAAIEPQNESDDIKNSPRPPDDSSDSSTSNVPDTDDYQDNISSEDGTTPDSTSTTENGTGGADTDKR